MFEEIKNIIAKGNLDNQLDTLKELEAMYDELPAFFKEQIEFKKKMLTKEADLRKELEKVDKIKKAIRIAFS